MAEVDRVLRELDVSFDAEIARREEDAANDLAYSLDQDLDIGQAIRSWDGARVQLAGGGSVPVEEVGADFLSATRGTLLVPTRGSVVLKDHRCGRPVILQEGLVFRLRSWARRGSRVDLLTEQGVTFGGRLSRVSRDHVEISGRTTVVAVSLEAIRSIRLDPEG